MHVPIDQHASIRHQSIALSLFFTLGIDSGKLYQPSIFTFPLIMMMSYLINFATTVHPMKGLLNTELICILVFNLNDLLYLEWGYIYKEIMCSSVLFSYWCQTWGLWLWRTIFHEQSFLFLSRSVSPFSPKRAREKGYRRAKQHAIFQQ